MNKIEELKISIVGDIEIVSSGYSDRYALSTTWMIIESESVKYRIDNANDRVPAVLRLAGLEMTDENWSVAYRAIQDGAFNTFATYEVISDVAIVTGRVNTTTARLEAGIDVAIGRQNLNEGGMEKVQEIASTLTNDEWLAIEFGLNKVNETHIRKKKPVVEFSIPNRNTDSHSDN